MSPPTEQHLFNNKFKIDEDGNFEAVGHFHATKSIKAHDGFEILDKVTEDVIFEIFVSGISEGPAPLPEAFDNALVFRTNQLRNQSKISYVVWNHTLNRPTMSYNEGGPYSATVIERSLRVGAQKGTRTLDENYTKGDDFPNLAFDTDQYGADFACEHDGEFLGSLYVDRIHESTQGAGVSINDNFKVIDGEVYILNLAGQGNKPIQVADDGRLYTLP